MRHSGKVRVPCVLPAVIMLAGVFVTTEPTWGQSAVWQPQGATSGNIYYGGGNVGIGTPSPGVPLEVRSNGVITRFYGTSGGNHWVEVGNGNSHMNLGVGASGSTAGVPYIWSAAGNFAIGNDGGPTLFVQGMGGGNVGIGTTNPQYKLAVNGNIGAQDITVTNTGWSDYVFQPSYRLRPLKEVSVYIKQHRHLPDIPSEAEVKEKGVSVGGMQAKLLAKVEELTLHMIEAEGRNDRLESRCRELEAQVAAMRSKDVKGAAQ